MYDLNVHASQFSRNYRIEHMFTSECSMPVSMYCLCEAKLVPLASLLCVYIYIYIYTHTHIHTELPHETIWLRIGTGGGLL